MAMNIIYTSKDIFRCSIEVGPYDSTMKIAGLTNMISIDVATCRSVDERVKVFKAAFNRSARYRTTLFKGYIASIGESVIVIVNRQCYDVYVDVKLLNGTKLFSVDLEDIDVNVNEEESD